eukprot:3966705-Alexandrium_andersonii.AAC.1
MRSTPEPSIGRMQPARNPPELPAASRESPELRGAPLAPKSFSALSAALRGSPELPGAPQSPQELPSGAL